MSATKATKGQGLLISVEGIDGAGKTTQAYWLKQALESMGFPTIYTTEPTYSRVGSLIRVLSFVEESFIDGVVEALLFAADRRIHVNEVIEPKLRNGYVVIVDRYIHSSLAYQGARGVDLSWIRLVNAFAPKPHLAIYIDVSPKQGLSRIGGGKTIFEKLDFLNRVREIYLELVRQGELILVQGNREAELVHREILSLVKPFLKKFRSDRS